MKVTKAVLPVAGLGTRFLPVTKSVPKEMLPIADRPCLEYIVAEAVEAGLTDLVFVTGAGKADALALTLGEPGPQAPASLLPADRMTLIADAAALGESDS